MHGFEFPAHERLAAELAREVGFTEISVSSEVAPLVKIVARGDTTVLDAYLNPVLRSYLASLRRALPDSDLRILTSAGGLVVADRLSGKDSILSGPAGGAIGFSRVAQAAGFKRAIGFDMGGTSTDVSRFDGRHEMDYETERAGVRVVAPMLAIETVAAGGGSICGFDGVKLIVGPDSAGADPGPACYGRGGPLAVTDLNFFLGKILPEFFPFPLDRAAVERRLVELANQIERATGRLYELSELADALLRVANANMVRAIRRVSVARGCDPREYLLVPFGGAAGQHACALARELGIRQLLFHPDAGLLSARGIGLADPVRHRVAGVYQPYTSAAVAELEPTFRRLADEAAAELIDEAPPTERSHAAAQIFSERRLDLRYRGVEAALTISEPPDGDFVAAFAAGHQRLYGYAQPDRPLEIVAARIEAVGRWATPPEPSRPVEAVALTSGRHATVWFDGLPQSAAVFQREQLRPGGRLIGPAIAHELASTTIVDPGWQADVLSGGELLLTDLIGDSARTETPVTAVEPREDAAQSESVDPSSFRFHPSSPDPALLEIFNNHFAGIAEQMGITLRNTAGSLNVKERLDFSCAIFTADGRLVVNAPHIPVHLGAMGETVQNILADNPRIEPGDVFVTNDPYRGGSHLPDLTVVTPVFGGVVERNSFRSAPGLISAIERNEFRSTELRFFTASRAHHAEIGGIVPGSMPPGSRNLAEEGVLIRNFKLVAAGRSHLQEFREMLAGGPYPSRTVNDKIADVTAQIAANRLGAVRLTELIDRQGWETVESYMRAIQEAAERKMRQALAQLSPGRREFVDHLDDGTPIRAGVTVYPPTAQSNWVAGAGPKGSPGGRNPGLPFGPAPATLDRQTVLPPAAEVDFTGTGPVSAGNLNANRAIVTAALMYVLRLLIDEEIPLNEGVLAPVRLIVPPGLLNPPEQPRPEDCPAMAGGNVETSQRVVDVLLGAFGLAAASQGTMNNLLFGDATFGYYETLCGGAGATPTADGADAVHTHMTNTRLTDPELLERRYPIRVQEFSIRRGSGGRGQYRGGDGVVRRGGPGISPPTGSVAAHAATRALRALRRRRWPAGLPGPQHASPRRRHDAQAEKQRAILGRTGRRASDRDARRRRLGHALTRRKTRRRRRAIARALDVTISSSPTGLRIPRVPEAPAAGTPSGTGNAN